MQRRALIDMYCLDSGFVAKLFSFLPCFLFFLGKPHQLNCQYISLLLAMADFQYLPMKQRTTGITKASEATLCWIDFCRGRGWLNQLPSSFLPPSSAASTYRSCTAFEIRLSGPTYHSLQIFRQTTLVLVRNRHHWIYIKCVWSIFALILKL